jgi:uncharacterized protein YyaL (SSP411 family)
VKFLDMSGIVRSKVTKGKKCESAPVPFAKDQKSIGGKPTAYVCKNYVCQLPTTDIKKLSELLSE